MDRYKNGVWALLRPANEYVHAKDDDRAFEESYLGLGRTFPHPLESTPGDHVRTVKRTPFGDELTLELVRALLDAEAFGRDEIPDLLAVSFSATDYVAHHFGPESLEAEDNHLRLDRTLAGDPPPPACAAQPQWTRLTVPPVRLASMSPAPMLAAIPIADTMPSASSP